MNKDYEDFAHEFRSKAVGVINLSWTLDEAIRRWKLHGNIGYFVKNMQHALLEAGYYETKSVTRSHYEVTAGIIATLDYDERAHVARVFAAHLALGNPNFDNERFLQACNIEATSPALHVLASRP